MTDNTTPPSNPRAEAKAAKAYAKATRPWFKKKRWWILIVIVVAIIAGVAGGGGSSDDDPQRVDNGSSSSTHASKGDSKKVGTKSNPIKVGETVKLQGTQYTVKKVGKTRQVGSEYFNEKANGVYIVVTLTIENKKNETKTFSDSATKVIGGNGKSYSTDTDGTIAAVGNGQEPLFLEEMQPDLPKTGKLVFDVPKAAVNGSLLQVSDLFGRGEAYIDLGL